MADHSRTESTHENAPGQVKGHDAKSSKFSAKGLVGDLLYNTVKNLGGAALKLVNNLEIVGRDNVPHVGKAILTTISADPMRDMLAISQVSGRKIHFMVDPKLMAQPIAGPLLKTVGMFRSTTSKDDMEPINNVFEILNEKGDLVAMTPEERLGREIHVKSMASIIKFAVSTGATLVPLGIATTHKKLLGLFLVPRLKVLVGEPIALDKKITRGRNRDKRYAKAAEIVDAIMVLRQGPEPEADDA